MSHCAGVSEYYKLQVLGPYAREVSEPILAGRIPATRGIASSREVQSHFYIQPNS
jgi:hypothetical protein